MKKCVKEGPGPAGNFNCSFDYDLTSDPKSALKALMSQKPKQKFILGLPDNQDKDPGNKKPSGKKPDKKGPPQLSPGEKERSQSGWSQEGRIMMNWEVFRFWNNLYFAEPDKLQLLWVVAAMFLSGIIVWLFKLYNRPARTYGSRYPFLGTIKFLFALMLTLFLCIVAYAQPFLAKGSVVIKRGSVEVAFIVDYSASMFLKDTGRARIDIAGREIMKTVSGEIIKEGDRAAIFIFGKIASPRIFLTRDLSNFANEADKIGRPDTLLYNDLYWGSAVGTTFQRVYQSLDRQDMIAEFHKESKRLVVSSQAGPAGYLSKRWRFL